MDRHTFAMMFVLLSSLGCAGPPPTRYPTRVWLRSTPEEQGIASRGLSAAVEGILDEGFHVHELLVVRHETIVLDARFFPYDGVRPHDIASGTKTLTALAVGAALESGAIASLDAPLLSFFEDRTVANDEPRKRAMTLADALTMRSGLSCVSDPGEVTLMAMVASPNPVQFALDLPMAAEPGTEWRYCGPASHLLSAVVGSATGASEDAWLRQRIFDRIGVGEVIWPHDAQGVAHGWGDARLHAEDLARIGLMLLHDGAWDGERILDADWVRAATANEVGTEGPPGGYGYQIWSTPSGAFYANGRGGQYVFVAPEEDLVVVTLGSAAPDEQARWIDILSSMILPAIQDAPLPASPSDTATLTALVARAAAPPAAQPIPPPPAVASSVSGSLYTASENPLGWQRFSLGFEADHASLAVTIDGTSSSFDIGLDGVARIARGGHFGVDPRHADLDLAATGRWTAENTFEVEFDTIDRVDAGTMTFVFDGDGVSVHLYERTYLRTDMVFEGVR